MLPINTRGVGYQIFRFEVEGQECIVEAITFACLATDSPSVEILKTHLDACLRDLLLGTFFSRELDSVIC